MCGRYGILGDYESIRREFSATGDNRPGFDWAQLTPRFNVAPTDRVPVVVESGHGRQIEIMRWGMLPINSHRIDGRKVYDDNGASVNTLINARAENVYSNKMFRDSLMNRRCIVPAGGYYEWTVFDGKRMPHWIYVPGETWIGFAGIYSVWHSRRDAKRFCSFAVITTRPNESMGRIHNRMPVILTKGSRETWLNNSNQDLSDIRDLLVPYVSQDMRVHRVSSLVNKVGNDSPELIEPYSDPNIQLTFSGMS